MTDIRIAQIVSPEVVTMDFLLTSAGGLDTTRELASAVTVALGTDRLAEIDDELPELDGDDRRGWWGDLDADQIHDGWPIGTRLWLLARTTITGPEAKRGSTIARVEHYAREALQPLLDRRVATRMDVRAERIALGRIDLSAILYRGPLPAVELRFADLWSEIGA